MVTSLKKPIKLAIIVALSIAIGLLIASLIIKNPLSNKLGVIKRISSNLLPEGMEILEMKQLSDRKFVAVLKHVMFDGLGVALLDRNQNFIEWLPEANFFGPAEGDKYPGEHLDWWSLEDTNNDYYQELAVQFSLIGSSGSHPFYLYQYKENSFNLPLKFTGGKSDSNLVDLNNDGDKEILYSFVLDPTSWFGRNYTPWKEVWAWRDGKYQLANNLFPDIYKELMSVYEGLMNDAIKDDLAEPYQPVIKCLQDKANMNIEGKLADGKDCSKIIFRED